MRDPDIDLPLYVLVTRLTEYDFDSGEWREGEGVPLYALNLQVALTTARVRRIKVLGVVEFDDVAARYTGGGGVGLQSLQKEDVR